jgi:hypothetical protein
MVDVNRAPINVNGEQMVVLVTQCTMEDKDTVDKILLQTTNNHPSIEMVSLSLRRSKMAAFN